MLSTEERENLRSKLMQEMDKSKLTYDNFAYRIGISGNTLKRFLFQPDKTFTKRIEDLICGYIENLDMGPLSIDQINLLRGQNRGLREQNKELQEENVRLKEENSILLSKNLEKQCKINKLQNALSTKEFSLKVNGKKYTNLSGIDKAKLFINNENAIRDKKILELEDFITSFQWKVIEWHKEITTYKQALAEIKEIAEKELYLKQNSSIKQILQKIAEVME